MTKVITGVVTAVILGCLGLPLLLAAATLGGGNSPTNCLATGTLLTDRPTTAANLDNDQIANAATIIDVGVAKNVPRWGWVIAIATALQESSLHNLPHLGDRNDHDSIGLFQQRPSQGWGTPDQLTDPAYQSAKFYDKLLTIPGWDTIPLTDAAQAVQVSAYPDRYAQWTDDAIRLVDTLATTGPVCTNTFTTIPESITLPATTPPAVVTAILWALGQLGTPYSFGGSCADPHSGNPALQCDCSSLVQRAYAQAGIGIPRVTTDQAHAGTPVTDPSALLPGDLILIPGSLGTPTDPRHVGMYLGNGLLIQAPQSGDVVKISPVQGWLADVIAMRRIVKADL